MINNFSDYFISLLGKPNTDENLIAFFVENNLVKSKKDIRLPIYDDSGDLLDEYNFYISKYNEGLSFIFTDETFYLNQSDKPISGEKLYLTTIFFYNDGAEGFSKYSKGLPLNLSFFMDRNKLESIFGTPIFTKKDDGDIIRSQKWEIEDMPYTLYVSYNNVGEIRYISLNISY